MTVKDLMCEECNGPLRRLYRKVKPKQIFKCLNEWRCENCGTHFGLVKLDMTPVGISTYSSLLEQRVSR